MEVVAEVVACREVEKEAAWEAEEEAVWEAEEEVAWAVEGEAACDQVGGERPSLSNCGPR